MADSSVQIRPIASKDIYPIRRTVLYPAGPDDAIYITGDDTAIHLGAYVTNQKLPRLSKLEDSEEPDSDGQLTAIISLFNDEFPSHLNPALALGSSTDPDLGFSPALRFRKFACLPDFQNRGIGSLLFRSVINYARDDCDDLTTTAPTTSTPVPDFGVSNSNVAHGKPVVRKRRMVWCAARSSAKDWYIKRGMKVYGDTYLKNNIEYVIMGIIV